MFATSRRLLALLLALATVAAACADDEPAATEDTSDGDSTDEDRCAANQAAGTITYVSGFDFAASPGIIDVVVAEAEGYFDEMCLDVELMGGFAPSNGPLVAAGQAQMSAASSFGEMVNNNVNGDADLVAVGQLGHTGVEALVVPADGAIAELTDLPGTTVGIKGDLPYTIQSMLGLAGVERGTFDEVLLEGFDPIAHLELDIDALPVYKSNEPGQLDAAGIDYVLFDPVDYDVPASFGVYFTSASFLAEHPTAVEDFVRAALRGFQFSLDDPDAAVAHAFERIEAAGNPAFLFAESEAFRWGVESALVTDHTPDGLGYGQIDAAGLAEEVALLTQVGVFDAEPDTASMIDTSVVDGLYDGTELIWPGPAGE